MRVLTWNLEWAKMSSWRASPLLDRLRRQDADVAVLTEAQVPVAKEVYPHIVDAGPHPRARQPNGSKVIVAARGPLEVVDLVGSPSLPPHNFVAVDFQDPSLGVVRISGVVVRWSEKRAYIDALPEALDGLVTDATVIAGDSNLSMRKGTPLEQDLAAVLANHDVTVRTTGPWSALENEPALIDHIAVSSALAAEDVRVWGRHVDSNERRLTDHAGVSLALAR